MRVVAVLLVVALLGGCALLEGAKDEGLKQGAEIAAEGAQAVTGQPAPAPVVPPDRSVTDGVLYTVGALLAYVLGSLGKGALRGWAMKRESES